MTLSKSNRFNNMENLEKIRQLEEEFAKRHERRFSRSPEAEQAEIEYWKKVFSKPAKLPPPFFTREFGRPMTFEQAREAFFEILKIRGNQIRHIDRDPNFTWKFDETEKHTIRNMLKYFINDPTCEYPLTKGLFIFGRNGSGKTEMMQAFERFCFTHNLEKTFVFTSMSGEYTKTKADGEYDPVMLNSRYDRCFDEFGRYTGPVKRFGDDLDINEAIIEARYDRHRRYGQITHFIANMTPSEAERTFTPMIFDRLRSMCTSIEFIGQSKRK
jgi:hypothetical protein